MRDRENTIMLILTDYGSNLFKIKVLVWISRSGVVVVDQLYHRPQDILV